MTLNGKLLLITSIIAIIISNLPGFSARARNQFSLWKQVKESENKGASSPYRYDVQDDEESFSDDNSSDEQDQLADGSIHLGQFVPFSHEVFSGDVYARDERTIDIDSLNYDGEGPAAWFILGNGDSDRYQREFVDLDSDEYTIIPDEDGSCDTLDRYRRQSIVLHLPDDIKLSDYDYLAMYCLRFNQLFGYVEIPNSKFKNATRSGIDDCPQTLIRISE